MLLVSAVLAVMLIALTACKFASEGSKLEIFGCQVLVAPDIVQARSPPVVPEVELLRELEVSVACCW